MRRPFIGGNWKMNTTRAEAVALAQAVLEGCDPLAERVEVAVYPPFVWLDAVGGVLRRERRGGSVTLGAQDVYHEPAGAFTGEVSTSMLREVGVTSVLAGHSERRHVLGEGDDLVNCKVRAATDAGLQCVLCIGELRAEREAGETDDVNRRQLRAGLREVDRGHLISRIVIAYEPVWAIGTGLNATPQDAQAAHAAIRAELARLYDDDAARTVRIIYGGSVKPANAADLSAGPDIDGFLVGGASLDAPGFIEIVRAAAL